MKKNKSKAKKTKRKPSKKKIFGDIKVKFGTKRTMGDNYSATFTIGVQGFTLTSVESKSQAIWYRKCVETALENLAKSVEEKVYKKMAKNNPRPYQRLGIKKLKTMLHETPIVLGFGKNRHKA